MTATTYGSTQKITISLPLDLVRQLNELVPARRRSKFIAEALARELESAEFLKALDEGFRVWKDEDYPELAAEADIDNFIRDMRAGWKVSGGEELSALPGGLRHHHA